ncbi:MAG: hypothetical protein ILN61_00960, partial [Lachnospiraceae bacterium]|nr:hypothetical protein [Lachnospiraceae bacterium]
ETAVTEEAVATEETVAEATDSENEAAALEQADRIVRENEEKVADLEQKFSKMTPSELLAYWKKVNKINTALENGTYVAPEEGQEATEEDDIAAAIRELGMQAIKSAMRNGIDAAVDMVPGAQYAGSPVKALLKKALGVAEEDEQVTVDDTVREEADRIIAKLEEMQKDNKKDNINSNTVSSYNKTLNNLDEFVDSRMEEIDNTNNNSEYNEVDKLVRNASTIGGEEDWLDGSNPVFDLMRAAADVLRGGKTDDKDNRSYLDLLYDYSVDSSLFTGEAMQKATKYFEGRLTRFIDSCGKIMEILDYHKKVAALTVEQVASMSAPTRAIYERIKSSAGAVAQKLSMIADFFFGTNKNNNNNNNTTKNQQKGIFETAENFQKKDRTVYIDYGHNGKGINLKDKIDICGGSTTYRKLWHIFNVDRDQICKQIKDGMEKDIYGAGLKKEDIDKIAKQAKALNMTIPEYLEYCGFDVSLLKAHPGILLNGCKTEKSGWWTYEADFTGYNTGNHDKDTKGTIYKSKAAIFDGDFYNTDTPFYVFRAE